MFVFLRVGHSNIVHGLCMDAHVRLDLMNLPSATSFPVTFSLPLYYSLSLSLQTQKKPAASYFQPQNMTYPALYPSILFYSFSPILFIYLDTGGTWHGTDWGTSFPRLPFSWAGLGLGLGGIVVLNSLFY